MVSARPLDLVRINQTPIQLVFKNPFDQFTVPNRILKVVAVPFSYPLSFSTALLTSQIPAPCLPPAARIPVSTRPPNTPHHRRVEFELLNDEVKKIPCNISKTVEPSSTETPSFDIRDSGISVQENDPSTIPPLIHNSEN